MPPPPGGGPPGDGGDGPSREDGDMGMLPPAPPPPSIPGDPYDSSNWSQEEWQFFESARQPAAEYGAAFPTGAAMAGMRHMFRLLLGVPIGFYALMIAAGFVFSEEEGEQGDFYWRVGPFSFPSMGEIPFLGALASMAEAANLSAKGALFGLDRKEYDAMMRHLADLPIITKFVRHAREKRKDYAARMRAAGVPKSQYDPGAGPSAYGIKSKIYRDAGMTPPPERVWKGLFPWLWENAEEGYESLTTQEA